LADFAQLTHTDTQNPLQTALPPRPLSLCGYTNVTVHHNHEFR